MRNNGLFLIFLTYSRTKANAIIFKDVKIDDSLTFFFVERDPYESKIIVRVLNILPTGLL